MASLLKLYLQPLNLPKWPLSYAHEDVAFAFAPPVVSPLPHPHSVDTLLAALDCGYGKILTFLALPPGAVPAPGFTNLSLTTKAEWEQLGTYIYGKVELLGDIFGTPVPPGPACVNTLSFVRQLEKNEKGSFSYFLGMVYARYALEQAILVAPAVPGFVSRILHFHTGQGGPIHIQGLPFPTVGAATDAPDFLVQLNNGTWGLIEAKGSLGNRKNSTLAEAQQQVVQYPMVNFSLGGGAPALLAVSFCAISYAYVENGNLQVEYIDPELDNDPLERVRRGEALANPIFMPAADCLRFLQACGHFASQADDGGEAELYMHWTRFKDGLWLGVPKQMWSNFEKLTALMTLFEAVFGKGCVNSSATLIEGSSVDFEVTFTRMARTRLQRLADDEVFIFHQHASLLLAQVDASRDSNEAIRLGAFAQDVADPKRASGMIANLNELLHSLRKYSYLKFRDESDRRTRFLSNGLCIADDAGRQFLDSNPLPNIERF